MAGFDGGIDSAADAPELVAARDIRAASSRAGLGDRVARALLDDARRHRSRHVLVRRGPYRFLRHPNYAIVAAEIAVLPLAFGAVAIAVAFTLLNAALLAWRIRVEDRALGR